MKFFAPSTALAILLALGACALPQAQTAAAAPHGYQEPDTGSLFGGGGGNAENPNVDPGLTGHVIGNAAPGGSR